MATLNAPPLRLPTLNTLVTQTAFQRASDISAGAVRRGQSAAENGGTLRGGL